MTAERVPTIYETPRLCLPCGQNYIPPRRPDGRILDYCSDACRRRAQRRSLSPRPFFGPRDRSSPAASDATPPRQPREKRLPGKQGKSGPRPSLVRVRRPEAVPTFGFRMASERLKRGWLRRDLAERIGVHKNSVAAWETGRNEPPVSKFAAIARAFGISLDALWYGEVMS